MDTPAKVKDATLSCKNIIKTSSSLALHDVKFYRSLDAEFSAGSTSTSRRIAGLAQNVIGSVGDEIIDLDADESFTGSNMKKVSNILDILFEKVDLAADSLKSKSKMTFLEDGYDDSKAMGKTLPKPQESFGTKVDNTELTPFKPKLTSKPNSVVPYEESIKLIDDEPPHYPHPYAYEIDNQPYAESILSPSTVVPAKPWESTSAIWIDRPEQVLQLVRDLRDSTEIAIDLEHHDYRTYYGLVCLMQISNREQDWVIDTLALRDDLQPLNEIFTNPSITKVFHGASMDIIWLQRDLGLYIVSLFDTYHASKKLGFPRFSLAYLLENFAHFKTSKKYQLADWRIRPLSTAMMAYARSDTHFLLNIFDQLKNKLLESDKLQDVLYESRQVAKRRFEYTKFRPLKFSNLVASPVMTTKEPYLPLLNQYNISAHLRPVVEALYNWRDELARDLDESVRYIMPNQILATLASLSKPVDAKKVLSVSSNEYIRHNAKELASIISDTLDLSEEDDWKLVDKLEAEDQELTPNIINIRADIFDQLCSENQEILNSNNLKSKSSILFKGSQPVIGISFDGGKSQEVPIQSLRERSEVILREFEKYNEPEIEIQVPEPIQEPAEVPIPQEQIEVPEPKVKEDMEEIITLRRPKKQRKEKKRKTDEEEFDYSNSDNLIKAKAPEQRKRRKFDPYSKESQGPKPARNTKNIQSGRSTTFKRS